MKAPRDNWLIYQITLNTLALFGKCPKGEQSLLHICVSLCRIQTGCCFTGSLYLATHIFIQTQWESLVGSECEKFSTSEICSYRKRHGFASDASSSLKCCVS